MTRDDAITITGYVVNAFPTPHWSDGQLEAFVNGLVPYDAELATQAVALAHRSIGFRPPLAEFLKFYRLAKTEAQSRQADPPRKPSGKVNKLPPWVKRWIVSRMLYVKFGKDQDLRRFREQDIWADPTTPLMPDDAWVKEAAAIGDREVMRTLQGNA